MRRSSTNWCAEGGAGSQRGFALLIVLWTLVLLALLVAHLTASGRVEARIAANLRANAAAEAAADGAAYEAAFRLIDGSRRHWAADGQTRHLALGEADIAVRIDSLAGRINPNGAPFELLDGLLLAASVPPSGAEGIAAAIIDWRTPPDDKRPLAAKVAPYRAAGLSYGAPGEPFETLDEVGRVLGMTPPLFARLKPHLSLYPDAPPDPARADPVVAEALRRAAQANPAVAASPPPNGIDTVAIRADAATAAGARFTRFAVLRAGAELPNGCQVLAWDTQPPE